MVVVIEFICFRSFCRIDWFVIYWGYERVEFMVKDLGLDSFGLSFINIWVFFFEKWI